MNVHMFEWVGVIHVCVRVRVRVCVCVCVCVKCSHWTQPATVSGC